jgi:hypothetical protein
LTRSSPPKITSAEASHNRPTPPRRADLRGAARRPLGRGGSSKADLAVVDLAHGALVLKDFGDKTWWVRWIGRLQIARECRAYERLGPQPGLPRFAGRIDAYALAVEWIEGEQLFRASRGSPGGAAHFAGLCEVVERLHAAGLAHLDLRGRGNVILGRDGRIRVVDLASAVWMRPGGLAHRWFWRWVAAADRAAVLKWKRVLDAGPYTDEEQAFLRRFRFWRSLWPFNRKAD